MIRALLVITLLSRALLPFPGTDVHRTTVLGEMAMQIADEIAPNPAILAIKGVSCVVGAYRARNGVKWPSGCFSEVHRWRWLDTPLAWWYLLDMKHINPYGR